MMMNGLISTEPELLFNYTNMSVLERQRDHLNYQHPGLDSTLAGFFSDNVGDLDGFLGTADLGLPEIHGDTKTVESDARLSILPENITRNIKKRKFNSVITETKDHSEKKKKMMMINSEEEEEEEEEEEKSRITEQNNESYMKTKNKSKKEQQSNNCNNDYIHVRARRGQATDSHSIAERARREKISERMKYLQDLVPGCDKITGKAGMLDEIINYVQSLQRQVEFLSMKLATVSPRVDFDIGDIFAKEVVSTPMINLQNNVMPCNEMVNSGYPHDEMVNSGYLHYNPMQQVVTSSDPLSCFNNGQAPLMWDSDVKNLYSSLGV